MKQKNSNHLKQLEEWTSLKCSELVFDSNVDNWSQDTSVLNEIIIGKSKLAFVVEDEDDGEIFGYYLNTQVIEEYEKWQETDDNSFQFNLQSKNNRLDKPMKFEIKDLKDGGISLEEKSSYYLIELSDICLKKENQKTSSQCYQNEDWFNYHGIQNALCGKTWENGNFFKLKRIFVIQMK